METNYSKQYPTAWKEGYKRGRRSHLDGFDLSKISTKSRFKDFWQKMAFANGIIDGWTTQEDLDNQEML